MLILAKWISRQQSEQPKKRRWLRYIDLIIVFVVLQVVLLLLLLVHSSSTSVTTTSSSQTSQVSTTIAAPQIPTTQNTSQQGSQSQAANVDCKDTQHMDGSCLEGVFNDNGDAYTNDTSPILNLLYGSTALFFYTPYQYTVENPQVIELWGGILIIVDIFIALVFLLNGIRVIFSGMVFRFDKAVEELPGIFLALIAAHVSLAFITAFLGLNNILTYETYQWSSQNLFQSNGIAKDEGNNPLTVNVTIGIGINQKAPVYDNLPKEVKEKYCDHKSFIKTIWHGRIFGVWQCNKMPADILIRSQLLQKNLEFTDFFNNLQDLGNGLGMLLKVMALMLMVQMIIRLFFLIVYIVTAPLGLACWALPGKIGQSVTGLWLKGFISTALVQFVMVLSLIVMQVLAGAILKFVTDVNPAKNADGIAVGPGNLDMITLVNLMSICFLWFIIRIPSLLGTAPMRTMVAAGQSMAQAVQTTVAVQIAEAQMVTSLAVSGVSMAASR
ncbi:hypothetical protein [Ktedonospora formicarum]|uniref:TrbL/VirB6 plasmid conjugal transfer protein n=1 Tax=Ktedonospora formicarum TaxID=2778364 RepID=A0A8J3IEA8_9CHLR|nr:hypothetical protein [Ktedonospora formicarum]GHO50419.1 hypothetical protein KSX_85820 [Ktedonospora formicarum]